MKRVLNILALLVVLLAAVFFLYCNNTGLANPKTVAFYYQLKDTLRSRGYSGRLLVVSTRRLNIHNQIQVRYAGAASRSRHLAGDALDFLVLDINGDGSADGRDVDIVYRILDREIIRGQGGIGTYKKERSFVDRQMIHIDCRGVRARWSR
jgi:uncharacterized protein YcbK (DUF882 family)